MALLVYLLSLTGLLFPFRRLAFWGFLWVSLLLARETGLVNQSGAPELSFEVQFGLSYDALGLYAQGLGAQLACIGQGIRLGKGNRLQL